MDRRLGLAAATSAVAGQVIAVGIFLTPASMARTLASPAWLLGAWLLMGGMALAGALSYGELASRYPEAGGGYVYLRETYGRRVAFLYGWKCLLVMDPGITAALASGLAAYVGYLMPLGPIGLKLVAVGAIAAAAAINIRGSVLSGRVLEALTVLKLAALAAIVLLAFGLGRGEWSHFVPFIARHPGAPPVGAALAGGLISAFFAFGGWWEASKLAGEVIDPARTMPRALALGVAIVTAAYVVTSAAFLYLVPLERVTSGEAFAAQAGEVLFGKTGGAVFAAIVVVSVAGSLFAVVMLLPRVYYAMGRDGVFPAAIGELSPRFGTPSRAIATEAILASVLVIAGTFEQIVAYFVFITVTFIALTVAAVYLQRRRQRAVPPYLTPGYPVTPAIFLSLVALLLVLIGMNNPRQALAGAAVVALGLPVYEFMERRRQRREPQTVSGSIA
jgi:basic amino acid/polyamine antiporter, APA family